VLVTLQPRESAGVLPYPFHVEPDGAITRQDFWQGKAVAVIGFASSLLASSIELPWFKYDPSQAPDAPVGMYVVTVDSEGRWGTHGSPIETVRVRD